VLDGGVGEIVELARANLRDIGVVAHETSTMCVVPGTRAPAGHSIGMMPPRQPARTPTA
jgi:hypothetical protein